MLMTFLLSLLIVLYIIKAQVVPGPVFKESMLYDLDNIVIKARAAMGE